MSGHYYIDNRRIDVPDTTHLRDDLPWAEWSEAGRAEKERKAEAGRKAMAAAIDAIHTTAPASTEDLIDIRAKQYRRRPYLLDMHFPHADLRRASPSAFLARVDAMIEQHRQGVAPRLYGFGGDSPEVSLHAARRFGEWMLAEEEAAA